MDIRRKLEQEYQTAVRRLRQLDGADEIEQAELGFGDNTPFSDEVDEIQAAERREMTYATRELLVDRVNRLAMAIDRLNDGEYGICTECSEPIAPARLRVMPEVATCVRCQDQIERYGRQLATVGASDDVEDE